MIHKIVAFKPSIEQALETAKLANDPRVRNVLFPRAGGLRPGTLPRFFNIFWFKSMHQQHHTGTGFGGLAATAAKAAQQPFQTFQAAKLTEAENRVGRFAERFI